MDWFTNDSRKVSLISQEDIPLEISIPTDPSKSFSYRNSNGSDSSPLKLQDPKTNSKYIEYNSKKDTLPDCKIVDPAEKEPASRKLTSNV